MTNSERQVLLVASEAAVFIGANFQFMNFGWEYTNALYSAGCAGAMYYFLTNSFKRKRSQIKKLYIYLIISGIFMVASAAAMVLKMRIEDDAQVRGQNEKYWIIPLVIAIAIQVYVVFSMPNRSKSKTHKYEDFN
jgi:hypothetical protein